MALEKLAELAEKALKALETLDQDDSAVVSITTQIEFIRDNARQNINPIEALGERKFTYSIIASREFSGPQEISVKEVLNTVSRELDKFE